MESYTFRVIIEPDGNEFHGYVPALPGCHTCGSTIEETRKNLHEAITLFVTYLRDKGETIPEESGLESFETVQVPKAAYT